MSAAQKKASVLGLVVMFVVLFAGLWAVLIAPSGRHALARQGGGQEGLTSGAIQTALRVSGLGPDALAAANLTDEEAQAVVAAVASMVGSNPDGLKNAIGDLRAAQAALDDLERSIRRGEATEQELATLSSKRAALANAISARDSLVGGIHSTATNSLSLGKKTTLATIRSNAARGLPTPYLVAARNDAQWVALRDALACERIAQASGGSVDQGSSTLLDSVRGEGGVSSARTAFDARHEDIAAAVSQAADSLASP